MHNRFSKRVAHDLQPGTRFAPPMAADVGTFLDELCMLGEISAEQVEALQAPDKEAALRQAYDIYLAAVQKACVRQQELL